MGMFDYVAFSMPCPVCSTTLTNWQSKSGDCMMETLTVEQLWNQTKRSEPACFYENCDSCGTWVDISLSPGILHDPGETERILAGEKVLPRRGPVFPEKS